MNPIEDRPEGPLWNPYLAGVVLGLVLFASFLASGKGLGASGAINRAQATVFHAMAPTWAEENGNIGPYFRSEGGPFASWIVLEVVGVLLGAGAAVWTRRSFRVETIHGPRTDYRARWILAAVGGALSGFAAQLGRGCTSGQVLTGGAQLAAGSWLYMAGVFGMAYLLAYPLRSQWLGRGKEAGK